MANQKKHQNMIAAGIFVVIVAITAFSVAGFAGGLTGAAIQNLPVGTIFVAGNMNGVLGGQTGADGTCQAYANNNGMNGRWVAMITTSSQNMIDKVPSLSSYYNMKGYRLASSKRDLFDGTLSTAVLVNAAGAEYRGPVWTGSIRYVAGTNCNDWTTYQGNGITGRSDESANSRWAYTKSTDCYKTAALYCLRVS